MERTAVVACLGQLLKAARDGENGFEKCYESASDPHLQMFFGQRADDHTATIEELEHWVAKYGGAVHADAGADDSPQPWVNVGAGIEHSDASLLTECERSQDRVVAIWRDAMALPLPHDVRSVVQQKLSAVQQNHTEVKSLRDLYNAAA